MGQSDSLRKGIDWVRKALPANVSTFLPRRVLGTTGVSVTLLGLGGQGYLQYGQNDGKAIALVKAALRYGINYVDTAPAYGPSQRRIGWATRDLPDGEFFLATKTHDRSYDGSRRLLEESMQHLGRKVDLWQLHNLKWPDADFAKLERGVVKALRKAKEEGMVRFIGVTCHSDPILLRAFLRYFPDFDASLFALNMADVHGPSFKSIVLPLTKDQGIGAVAMKVMGRGALVDKLVPYVEAIARMALAYPLSCGVDCAIVGFDDTDQLKELVDSASGFTDLTLEEMERLEVVSSYARQEGNWFKVCFEGTSVSEKFKDVEPMP